MPDHHKKTQTHPAPLPRQRLAGPVVAGVVFAYVDVTRYMVQEHDGADDTSAPIDPDGVDEPDDAEGAARSLKETIGAELGDGEAAGAEPRWSFVTLAGEPARALGRFAESVHACLIVVGTREGGVGSRLENFLSAPSPCT